MRENESPYPIWIKFCRMVDILDLYADYGDDRLQGFKWQGVKFVIT